MRVEEIQVGKTYCGRTSGHDRRVVAINPDGYYSSHYVVYRLTGYHTRRSCTLSSFARWAESEVETEAE